MTDSDRRRPLHVYVLATAALLLFAVHVTQALNGSQDHTATAVAVEFEQPPEELAVGVDVEEIRIEVERLKEWAEAARQRAEERRDAHKHVRQLDVDLPRIIIRTR